MFPLSAGRTLASGTCPRVQVVATHPLEATLVAAPLLLHAVAAGAATAVCAVTSGADRPGFGALRGDELRRAARRLWVSQVDVLDHVVDDTGFDGLRPAVERFAPDVLVVTGGTTALHGRLLSAAQALADRVYVIGSPVAGPGLRVPLSTTGQVWAWRRALAEHSSETAVPLPDEGSHPHVVLERVDGPRILVHTRHEHGSRLRLVPSPETRSA